MDEDAYDEAVDEATHKTIEVFDDCLTLPDGNDLSELMFRVNDALTQIFAEYK